MCFTGFKLRPADVPNQPSRIMVGGEGFEPPTPSV